MKFKPANPPHISFDDSTRTMMMNVSIMLLVLYGMAFYFYGIRVVVSGAISVATALATDWLTQLLFGRKPSIHDWSAGVTGLIIPLLLPASIPFHIIIFAVIFGIVVAKQPFGGVGNNVFNPAAAGYAFVVTSFPASVIFRYPIPFAELPIFPDKALALTSSASYSLSAGTGGIPNQSLANMLRGYVPGPMGATSAMVIMACLLFLILRKVVSWEIPVFFLATTTIIAAVMPRIAVSPLESIAYETMSGLLLFGATFMLGDPVTTPIRGVAKAAYAILCGIMVMAFRHVGKTEEGFVFALLFSNGLVWLFDMMAEHIAGKRRRKHFEAFRDKKV